MWDHLILRSFQDIMDYYIPENVFLKILNFITFALLETCFFGTSFHSSKDPERYPNFDERKIDRIVTYLLIPKINQNTPCKGYDLLIIKHSQKKRGQ